ncbi:PEP-CTERM sorting domain-containing protein [Colwellia sp. Bg11-28]|uniref:PEP-CTERM sorting domain-containing protein n=1 Tax=Colwellia sp. Bg11-28 TaxID=2058305 RepID=UPI001E536563|nr:PEP-CTERM sorting domain-containing protein [Colwellia sp. Bg11-28]
MNMKMLKAALAGLVLSVSSFANAGVIPLGNLEDGTVFSGTVIGDDDSFIASLGDYWTFNGAAGDIIDIDINRTEASPDLIATLFFGDVTGLDVDSLSPDGLINGLLVSNGVFGPLTVIDTQDDTENDSFGGPFGDPRFNLSLSSTGTYTLLVATLSAPGSYEISTTGITSVPEPSTLAIFALGIMGLAARRFKKQ